MKKKLWTTIIFVLVIAVGLIYWRYSVKFSESFDWDYEGRAVVLNRNPPYEFVEITDVILDGELFGFGKYFLGDLRIGTVEAMRHYKGNPESAYYALTGVMTMYRYALLSNGEEYFEDKKIRDRYAVEAEPATKIFDSDILMLMFRWEECYEYANQEGSIKMGGMAETGYFYFREKEKEMFVVETGDYWIVPGVSTSEEALAVLAKNFGVLGHFEECD